MVSKWGGCLGSWFVGGCLCMKQGEEKGESDGRGVMGVCIEEERGK